MKHLKLTVVGLVALTAAAPSAFAFGPPGGPPMGGPPMGGPPMGGPPWVAVYRVSRAAVYRVCPAVAHRVARAVV